MAFVASSRWNNLTSGPLPLMIDVAGNTDALCTFSHIRVVGAGTVTFDTGQVLTSATGIDSVFALPPAARSITIAGGTPTVQLGQMV